MEHRKLVCICCPMGCTLDIALNGIEILGITGHNCSKGKIYGEKECTAPVRTLTTTIETVNGCSKRIPVKTELDIPKEKLFDCVKELKNIQVTAPIHIGDVILKNIADTGVNIVATAECESANE